MEYRQRRQKDRIVIRPSCDEDIPYLAAWLSDAATNMTVPCGEPKEIEECAKGWVKMYEHGGALTAVVDDVPRGILVLFLQTYRQLIHQCMHVLVVDPAYRQKGVGSLLLEEGSWWAKEGRGVELLHAEVTEGTEAEPFYRRQGFEQFARQEGAFKVGDKYFNRILVEKLL